MKQALEQKDLDLAAAQKMMRGKTKLADNKSASFSKLEEENAKLKTANDESNKEVVQLKKDKVALTDKVGDLTRKRDKLEAYLGGLAKKMFLMLEGTFPCPTDLPLSTHRLTVDSPFFCMRRILSKLRGRGRAD